MLDARIASALDKIIQNSQFKKKVSLEEQKAQQKDRFLRGRQIAFMINDCFRVTHDTVLDHADFSSVSLHDDNIQEFDSRCEYVSLRNLIPYWNCTTWRFIRRYRCPIIKIEDNVKRSIEQKLRLRNFDARHVRIETGAVVKNRKGLCGVEGGKGTCYQWNEKGQCSKGDQCSFQHESDDRAQKTTPKAATLSEPPLSRGRSVSKKKTYPRQK